MSMENNNLKTHFEEFYNSYPEDDKNQIWTRHSKDFHDFWENKILNPDYGELNDMEIDDIVMIMDSKGKGNTPQTESVASVMIAQGAWRRLFNQLHEDNKLSGAIESIFKSESDTEKIDAINKLYTVNEGNKNNLTGKSGNAVNTFLAVYDPFKYLSIVSLRDREKLLSGLDIAYSGEGKSIGEQIVETSNLILQYFANNNLSQNARAISNFAYSKPFVSFWKNIAEKAEEEISVTDDEPKDVTIHDDFIFYMEKQLEDFLIENWDKTELGQKYELINGEEGLMSQQYKTEIGIIDILARDKKDNKYVIIELKKNQTSDDTIGQIARYMGWVEENLSNGVESKGIIIAGKDDKKLKYAMRKIKGIEVYLYKVDFKLEEYSE